MYWKIKKKNKTNLCLTLKMYVLSKWMELQKKSIHFYMHEVSPRALSVHVSLHLRSDRGQKTSFSIQMHPFRLVLQTEVSHKALVGQESHSAESWVPEKRGGRLSQNHFLMCTFARFLTGCSRSCSVCSCSRFCGRSKTLCFSPKDV